jgi:hypothetical protein
VNGSKTLNLDVFIEQVAGISYHVYWKKQKADMTQAFVIGLHQQLLQSDRKEASALLDRIQSQTENQSHDELERLVIPLLEQMMHFRDLYSLDTSCSEHLSRRLSAPFNVHGWAGDNTNRPFRAPFRQFQECLPRQFARPGAPVSQKVLRCCTNAGSKATWDEGCTVVR